MLQLRSVHASGLWDEFTAFRMAKERKRLYPDTDKSETTERLAA